MRPSKRAPDELREIRITRHHISHAEGSVLIEFGGTKVICTASIEEGVPRWLKKKNKGWVTAEYGMLPRSTETRIKRESMQGRPSGRTMEIQRLIARSLRAVVDLKKLGERTILVDCDVIQADGGTRTASITGAYVALVDALRHLQYKKLLKDDPILNAVASVSVGLYQGQAILDLDYAEDAKADTDMNIVMNGDAHFIEIQGTAEKGAFDQDALGEMLSLAKKGIDELLERQRLALSK